MVSPIRALIRLTMLLLVSAWVIAVQSVGVPLGLRAAKRNPGRFYRLATRATGMKLALRGTMVETGPVLFVSNHSSYLDIFALGGLIGGSFIAKSEIRSWPIIGYMARLGYTVFVTRRPRYAAEQRDELMDRLRAGDKLVLFPEGTSNDGNRTLPFKSALFSAAQVRIDGQPVTVQPVSIAYTHLDGMPLGRNMRPYYAWYGDMDLFSHIWNVMGLGRVTATVEFHPPVTIDRFGSRKSLAAHCEGEVSRGVASALSGRDQVPKQAVPDAAVAASPNAAGA